jgi:hypothetical protein
VLGFGHPALLRQVIVNLKDDATTALSGVLWQTRGRWLILRNASVLKAGEPPAEAVGELLVHRDNVSFLQAEP